MASLKKVTFFFFFLSIFVQSADAQNVRLAEADSLFRSHSFRKATAAYEEVLARTPRIAPAIYLKLAFLHEQRKDWLKEQYYLNLYYEQVPDERVLQRMNEIARTQNWKGYELDDFNLLVLLFKQYSGYLIGVLLVLGTYVFIVLLSKRVKKQYIPFRHKAIFFFYWLGVALLVNLPGRYRQVIIRNPDTILRQDPSGGALPTEVVTEGHRLKVLGKSDIWYQVLWDNRLAYVKAADVWVVR
ncbi:MAG: tetratricopeptide repeat protein [Siphonobacter aquaeclarae]|nr:tetratricopeptide repeat protein [Siphonobacter aquaeclarae]